MRDVLAVASVIVVALGLGGLAASMSVDLTPPGLELIRPPKPAVAARIQREEKQRTIQAEASECKYCTDLADLAKKFGLRADTARDHAAALKKALPQVSDETELTASRVEELRVAEAAATRAEAAASVLTNWAARCRGEQFCKVGPQRVAAASCASAGDPRPAATLMIALSVRKAAQSCANAACPAVDCQTSAALRSDIGLIEQALDAASGDLAVVPGTPPAQLAVGPSTLKAELTRVRDEANYVTKLVPLLLDTKKAGERKLPKLAPAMVDERALVASQIATVMEQSANVADVKGDPRQEAAWRLKSLAANLAMLGKDAQPHANGSLNWERIADSIGGSLLDLARLHAMLDRISGQQAAGADCDTSIAAAAQQLREARAMLDHCRMRAACVGGGRRATTVQAAAGGLETVFARASAAADALIVNELGNTQQQMQVAATEPAAIELLRAQGVCKRASDLREAAVVAPDATQAAAEAVAPALAPAIGAVAPQDVITGAVEAALDAPGAPSETTAAAEALVQVASPAPELAPATAAKPVVTPKRKPKRMTNDPALMPAAAPPRSTPTVDPAAPYMGGGSVVIPSPGSGAAFGSGEGGPQQLTPPPTEEPPPAKPQ